MCVCVGVYGRGAYRCLDLLCLAVQDVLPELDLLRVLLAQPPHLMEIAIKH